MNSALRTSLLATIALACIDAEAKPAERCILSLEARPMNVETSSGPMRADRYGRPRCPLAVVYPDREARVQGPRSRVVSGAEARLDETVDAEHEPAAPPRPALHV